MAKSRKRHAAAVAYEMGLTPPAQTPDGRDIKYGRKALVGQYIKKYMREDGTEGVLDLSEVINSRR